METQSEEAGARISVDPNVRFGTPCVAGTRIPVRDVLELLRAGHSVEAITTDYYPDLEEADVQACVQYVITAMHDERRARGSDRISVGRANEGEWIDETGRRVADAVRNCEHLRCGRNVQTSPRWR